MDAHNAPMGDTPTALYRFYDANGALLYVGVTCNLGRRFERHGADKSWWERVARSSIEHYPTRTAALAAEKAAILAEHPVHNIRHNRRPMPAPEGAEMDRESKLDRLSSVDEQEFDPKSLVGSYFHSFEEDGGIKWQGCVVAEPAAGWYLVELFSWVMGDSTAQHLVPIDDMRGWVFYDTARWMNNAYDTKLSRRGGGP